MRGPTIARHWNLYFSFTTNRLIRKCPELRLAFSWVEIACGLFVTTCVAREKLKMLHALPDSTSSVLDILLILIGMLRGSIFAMSFWVRATVLSYPLKKLSKKVLPNLWHAVLYLLYIVFFLGVLGIRILLFHADFGKRIL